MADVIDLPTIEWRAGRVRLLDQRVLPGRVRFVECRTVDDLIEAIQTLAVRGAPALGAAGAYGVALAAHTLPTTRQVRARPRIAWRALARPPSTSRRVSRSRSRRTKPEAHRRRSRRPSSSRVTTWRGTAHSGRTVPRSCRLALACSRTATPGRSRASVTAPRSASSAPRRSSGRDPRVWVDETRPLLQGARLTMFELGRLGIDATLITDSAAASLMAAGEVDLVILGADRIAANGDVANKVGTYSLAVLAHHHGLPFYVAAPTSTIDPGLPTERRSPSRSGTPTKFATSRGRAVAPEGAAVRNPAFDVTPGAPGHGDRHRDRHGPPPVRPFPAARTSGEPPPRAGSGGVAGRT